MPRSGRACRRLFSSAGRSSSAIWIFCSLNITLPAPVAGLYAAVALVGRVVYMFSWSVISSMFPVSAASVHQQDKSNRSEERALAGHRDDLAVHDRGLVDAHGACGRPFWGRPFSDASHASFSSLLASYSAMTSIYSVAVVLLDLRNVAPNRQCYLDPARFSAAYCRWESFSSTTRCSR